MKTHAGFSFARFAFVLFLCGSALSAPSSAWATFDLSVDSVRGGRDIRLEPASRGRQTRNEEVAVTVTSTEGKQYRIRQHVMGPLTNERGEALPASAVKVFSPSSVPGRLNIVFPTDLRMGQDFIYTSDSSGQSTTFNLVFAIDETQIRGSGRYQTQIRYELEAATGDVAIDSIVKNIIVEMRSEFDVRLRGVDGGAAVDFGRITKNRLSSADAIELEISSNLGERYRIYQEASQPLMSATGNRISEDRITVQAAPEQGGAGAEKPFSTSRELLYESDGSGPGGVIRILYKTAGLADQLAGVYATSLNLTVESDSSSAAPKSFTVPVRLEVETILYIDVESEGALLNFGKFKEPGDTQQRQVHVRAFNNTGERYQVSQVISRPFTNAKGDAIPQDHFVAVMKAATSGTTSYLGATPVKIGETTIFSSDARGGSSEFDIDYALTLPKDIGGGNYSAEVTYSISLI